MIRSRTGSDPFRPNSSVPIYAVRMTEKIYGPREDPEPAPAPTPVPTPIPEARQARMLSRYALWGAIAVLIPSLVFSTYATKSGGAPATIVLITALAFTAVGTLIGLVAGLLVMPLAKRGLPPWIRALPATLAPGLVLGMVGVVVLGPKPDMFRALPFLAGLLGVCAYLVSVWHEYRPLRRRRSPTPEPPTADEEVGGLG